MNFYTQKLFVQIGITANLGKDGKSDLLTVYRGRVENVLDEELGVEVEVCKLDIRGREVCVSSANTQTMPMYRFNGDYIYMAMKIAGRSRKVALTFNGAKGSLAKVQISVGTNLSFVKEVTVFQPVNGFYEVITMMVDGESLTFRANCCRPKPKNVKVKRNEPKEVQVEQDEPKKAA